MFQMKSKLKPQKKKTYEMRCYLPKVKNNSRKDAH